MGFRIVWRGIVWYMPRGVEKPLHEAVADDHTDTTRTLYDKILSVYM